MALTFFWRCESTTFSGTDDYSAGDSTPTANNGIAAPGSTQAKVGTNSVGVDNLGEYYSFDKASIIAIAEGSAGFWFYPSTWEAGAELFRFVDAAESSNYLRVVMLGTDELRAQVSSAASGNTPIDTTAANLSTGNWYWCVLRWHASNQDLRIEVYSAADLTTPVDAAESLTVTAGHFASEALMDEVRFGDSGGMTSGAYYLDNIMLADSYSEPLQTYANYTSYTQTQAAAITDVNLLSLTNVPRASLTSLKWSWFDSVLPGSYSAPVVQGTTESTDGSGNISLTLTGSVLTSGQEGTLVLSNSAGTLIGAYRLAVD